MFFEWARRLAGRYFFGGDPYVERDVIETDLFTFALGIAAGFGLNTFVL